MEEGQFIKVILKILLYRISDKLSVRLSARDLLNLLALFPFKHSPKALMGHSAWGGYACGKKFGVKFSTFFLCISIILSFCAGGILKACFTRHAGDRIDIFASILPLLIYQYCLILSFLLGDITETLDKC